MKTKLVLVIPLLLICGAMVSAAEENQNQVISCTPYNLSDAQVQGFKEIDVNGISVREGILINNLNSEATEKDMEDFFEEVSDYALKMGLLYLADCSQEEFEKQMSSGMVLVYGPSPEDGFLSKEVRKIEGHGDYCLVVREGDGFFSTREVDVVIVNHNVMIGPGKAQEAVNNAQYFGLEYGMIVKQNQDNCDDVMNAAGGMLEIEAEMNSDGLINSINEFTEADNYGVICKGILSLSRVNLDTESAPTPIPVAA